MPKNLNLQMIHKVSSISVALMTLTIPLLLSYHTKYNVSLAPAAGFFLIILFINILVFNRKLYVYYTRRRGLSFMIRVIPLHLLYYLYSGMSFLTCWITIKTSTFISYFYALKEQNAEAQRKD